MKRPLLAGGSDVPYRVILKPAADRDLDKLPRDVARRIAEQLRALATDPRPPGTVKMQGTRNEYRVRVGDYRIVFEVNDREQTVRVGRIANRREVYK